MGYNDWERQYTRAYGHKIHVPQRLDSRGLESTVCSLKNFETDLETWKCNFLFKCDPEIPGYW